MFVENSLEGFVCAYVWRFANGSSEPLCWSSRAAFIGLPELRLGLPELRM